MYGQNLTKFAHERFRSLVRARRRLRDDPLGGFLHQGPAKITAGVVIPRRTNLLRTKATMRNPPKTRMLRWSEAPVERGVPYPGAAARVTSAI